MKRALTSTIVLASVFSLFMLSQGVDTAAAKKIELIVQNHDPASSICGQYVEAWGSKVEAEAKGDIKFVYYHGGSLVGARGSVDAVTNGTADLAVLRILPGVPPRFIPDSFRSPSSFSCH